MRNEKIILFLGLYISICFATVVIVKDPQTQVPQGQGILPHWGNKVRRSTTTGNPNATTPDPTSAHPTPSPQQQQQNQGQSHPFHPLNQNQQQQGGHPPRPMLPPPPRFPNNWVPANSLRHPQMPNYPQSPSYPQNIRVDWVPLGAFLLAGAQG